MYDKTLRFLVFIASIVISNPPLTATAEFCNPNSTAAGLDPLREELAVTATNISHASFSSYRPRLNNFVMPAFRPRTDLETFPQENHSAPSLKELAMLKVLSACPFENFEDYVPSLLERVPTDLTEEAREFLMPSNSDKLKQYYAMDLLKGKVFKAVKQKIEAEKAELRNVMLCHTDTCTVTASRSITLCGTNTYSGSTTISAGALARTGTLVLGLHNRTIQEESADPE